VKTKKTKKNEQKTNPVIILIIIVCLLYVIYNSLVVFTLGLFGELAVGTLTSYDNRVDDSKAPPNQSRTVTKGYRFSVAGKEYRGHSTYKSDEAWPRLREGEVRTELIRYLGPFPRINKPANLVDFDNLGVAGVFYYLVMIVGSVFFLVFVLPRIR